MGEWPTYSVEELVEAGILERPIDGNHGEIHPKSADFVKTGIPFVMASDLVAGQVDLTGCAFISRRQADGLRKGFAKVGDVLLSHKATIGRTAIVQWNNFPFVVLTPQVTYYRVKDRDKLSPRYLRAYFDSSEFQQLMGAWAGAGSTRAYIGITAQLKLPVRLPPIEVQNAIAETIVPFDDKIELNRRTNETLEAMARSIFRDWFVDFGPTRAKMEGREPYLAPDLWSLFPDRLDDQGKPEGWVTGTLGDVAQQAGESVNPESLDPGTPYIGLEHMPRKSIALSDWEGAGKVTSGKLAFRKGDFLFGKLRPYFHKVGIAPIAGICSTDIVVLNARQQKAGPFVLACISQDEFIAFTDRTSDGTKMPRTSWGRMERYSLCLPSTSALEAFNTSVKPMLDRIVSNIHESRTLAATRNLLLPKLMSGEVRIIDSEKLVGEAT